MITPEDIKLQLVTTLPVYTEMFGLRTQADSAKVSSNTEVTIIKNEHGLKTNDVIVCTSAIVKVPITSVEQQDDNLLLNTSFYHDRTSGSSGEEYTKAIFADFEETAFNKEYDIIDLPAKNSILIEATAPTGTLGYLKEPRNLFLGPSEVTVVDENTFKIPRSDLLPVDTEFFEFKYSDKQRIEIAASEVRAYTKFTQRTNAQDTLYVIMGPEEVSKDRDSKSDAIAAVNSQNPARMTYLASVTLLGCFQAPPGDNHLAAVTQQKVYAELKPALRKAMYGHVFDMMDKSVTPFAAIDSGSNSMDDCNKGFYLHRFTFSIPYTITIEQGDVIRRHTSFRDVVLKSRLFNTETVENTLETGLDF